MNDRETGLEERRFKVYVASESGEAAKEPLIFEWTRWGRRALLGYLVMHSNWNQVNSKNHGKALNSIGEFTHAFPYFLEGLPKTMWLPGNVPIVLDETTSEKSSRWTRMFFAWRFFWDLLRILVKGL